MKTLKIGIAIRDVAASAPARQARERIKDEMFAGAGLGAMAGASMIVLFLAVFWYRGARLGRQRRLRGAELVTARELRRRIQLPHARLLEALPGGKRLATLRACSLRTVREQRSHAGCNRAAMSIQAESSDRESARQSGP